MLESRLKTTKDGEKYVEGYFLTIDQLEELTKDFLVDSYDGFVSNSKAYIEAWIKRHEL